jgi:hypothetical protein
MSSDRNMSNARNAPRQIAGLLAVKAAAGGHLP